MDPLDELLCHLQGSVSHRFALACLLLTPITHLAGCILLAPAAGSRLTQSTAIMSRQSSFSARFLHFTFTGGRRHAVLTVVAWGMVQCMRCWLLGASALMMTTQVILALSLLTWQTKGRPGLRLAARVVRRPVPAWVDTGKVLKSKMQPRLSMAPVMASLGSRLELLLNTNAPILITYLPVQLFFSCWALTFAFCPTTWMPGLVYGWLTFTCMSYVATLIGEPQHTGALTWPAFRDWIANNMERSLVAWFGSVQVVADWDDTTLLPHEAAAWLSKDTAGAAAGPCRHILGFHPHGLYPSGAGFLPMLPEFKRLLPHIRPITLTASVLFYVPAIKELSLWLGFRQVSRRTFQHALRESGSSVIICPGGQAELVYTYASHVPYPSAGFVRQQTEAQHAEAPEAGAQHTPRIAPAPGCAAACPPVQAVCEGAAGAAVCLQKSQGPGVGQLAKALSLPSLTTAIVQPAKQWLKGAGVAMHAGELVIYAGHKGFVRMAIEQQACLVPVLALGEVLQLRNLIHMPQLQRWTYKHWGFPFPYFLCGRGGITPLPSRVPLVYVLGAPIQPPPLPLTGEQVLQEDVDALHARFYAEMEGMFHRHKHRNPAFENAKLTMLYKHIA